MLPALFLFPSVLAWYEQKSPVVPQWCRPMTNETYAEWGPRFFRTCATKDEQREALIQKVCVCLPGYIRFGRDSTACILEEECPDIPECRRDECLREESVYPLVGVNATTPESWKPNYHCVSVDQAYRRSFDGFCDTTATPPPDSQEYNMFNL